MGELHQGSGQVEEVNVKVMEEFQNLGELLGL